MNQAEVKKENLTTLRMAADRTARALCAGVRRDRSKKQLLAILAEQIRSLRIRCPACPAEVPVLLGPADARHICVVAKRSSFVNLRRRLEEYFRTARPKCPSCTAKADNPAAEEGPDVPDEKPRESGGVAEGVARTATEA